VIIALGGPDYRRFSYPAGELQVRFVDKEKIAQLRHTERVDILARITSSSDILELMLLRDAIGGINSKAPISLILPYLPYARADRRFLEGDCLGIATLGRILFVSSLDKVITLDVHSPIAQNWMNLKNVSADPFIEQATNKFANTCNSHAINILLPDEGALGRYSIPAITGCNTFGVETQVFYATKQREPVTGKLLGFEVPPMPVHPTLIVDDICDGGGTFLGIAKQLPEIPDLALYTTHGIYSQGFAELEKYFKCLYTTNSFATTYRKANKLMVMDCVSMLILAAQERN
jgi:ribose-phosphate pyrophosphokinase